MIAYLSFSGFKPQTKNTLHKKSFKNSLLLPMRLKKRFLEIYYGIL